jgi:hypothetical protein
MQLKKHGGQVKFLKRKRKPLCVLRTLMTSLAVMLCDEEGDEGDVM